MTTRQADDRTATEKRLIATASPTQNQETARKVAERYSWEPIARRLVTIYEELQDEGVREQAAA